jgi:hypothetical protein
LVKRESQKKSAFVTDEEGVVRGSIHKPLAIAAQAIYTSPWAQARRSLNFVVEG